MVMLQAISPPASHSTSPQSAKAQNWYFQQTQHEFQADGESSSGGKAGNHLLFSQK